MRLVNKHTPKLTDYHGLYFASNGLIEVWYHGRMVWASRNITKCLEIFNRGGLQ